MNRAARLVVRQRIDPNISIRSTLKRQHWLPVAERIEFKIATMIFKALHGLAPDYLTELLRQYIPPRPLRSSLNPLLLIPRSRNKYGQRAFSVIGPTLWNSLPCKLRATESFAVFRKLLKTYLFIKAYTDIL